MPTTYAHYRFGAQCIEMLPPDLQKDVEAHRALFDYGVHGPDIFFYYHPFRKNDVRSMGSEMHVRPVREFFERCRSVLAEKHGIAQPATPAERAYLLGFLTHFMLDSSCHGYVDRKKEVSGISHNKIESEFDAHLLRKDGKGPASQFDRSNLLHPDEAEAEAIAPFFALSAETMQEALREQKSVLHFFHSPGKTKKSFIRGVVRGFSLGGDYGDLFLDDEEAPKCKDSNLRLDKLMALAARRFAHYLPNFLAFFRYEAELDAYFDHHFEPWPDYQSIPILSLEEEQSFEVEAL